LSLRAIAKGGYVKHRVFFADEQTAISAGFRPYAVCMFEKYARWKKKKRKEKIRGIIKMYKMHDKITEYSDFFLVLYLYKYELMEVSYEK